MFWFTLVLLGSSWTGASDCSCSCKIDTDYIRRDIEQLSLFKQDYYYHYSELFLNKDMMAIRMMIEELEEKYNKSEINFQDFKDQSEGLNIALKLVQKKYAMYTIKNLNYTKYGYSAYYRKWLEKH